MSRTLLVLAALVDVESGEFINREMVCDGVLDFEQRRQAE